MPLSNDDDLLEKAIPIHDAILNDDLDQTSSQNANPATSSTTTTTTTTTTTPAANTTPTIKPVVPAQPVARSSKIRSFEVDRKRHDEHWERKPNATGQGAIHVKTFYCKLRGDGIAHMDEQINHWLDAHPEYEVKFTTSTIGPLVGKTTEEALFVQVWV